MEQYWVEMGMPIAVTLADAEASVGDIEAVRDWFKEVDRKFSTFRPDSQISQINAGRLTANQADSQVKHILDLCQETTRLTDGYFSIKTAQGIDPSGLVKGWAIGQAAELLSERGRHNFYVDAGGDVAAVGGPAKHQSWRVGIRHPWQHDKWVKVLAISNGGVATSGTSARGQHIINPHTGQPPKGVVSLTVIGPDIFEADRMATSAFAMGFDGLGWLERQHGLEAYLIDDSGRAFWTEGFERYVVQ